MATRRISLAGRRRTLSYALILYGMTVLVTAATVPLALYQTYAEEFHFSPAVLTMLAASTVVGMAISFVFIGRVSDAVGRRPVMLPGLVVGVVSVLAFLLAHGVALLFVGRILSGVAVGAFSGAGTAALIELAPAGGTRRAATHAATTAIAGFAIGPLIGGVFVQYGPWPLRLVYVFTLALFVPAFVGVLLMRETMTKRQPLTLRPQAMRVPHPGGRTFGLATLVALCAFGTASFFQSLGPTIVIRLLHVSNRMVAVAVVVCFLGSSAVAQVRFRHVPVQRATVAGLALLPVGTAMIVTALLRVSLPLFIAGAVVGGLGQGLSYLGGQALVEQVAPPERRGEVFSLYLVICYASGSMTATALGFSAKSFGLHPAAIVFATLIGTLTVVTAFIAVRARLGGARIEVEPGAPLL